MRRWTAAALAIGIVGAACGGSASAESELLANDGSSMTLSPQQSGLFRQRLEAELEGRTAEGSALLDDGAVRIETTIDPAVQAAIDTAVESVPDTGGRFVPVVLVTDTRTGAVLGVQTAADSEGRDVLGVPRGSGSTLKLVVLLAASRLGVTPETRVDGGSDCRFPTDEGPYDASTAVTLVDGTLADMTAASINCAFAPAGHERRARSPGRGGVRPRDGSQSRSRRPIRRRWQLGDRRGTGASNGRSAL